MSSTNEETDSPVMSRQLPPDNHTHTEHSWDAENGSMEASCVRAIEIGLPSIAFTEHVDLTPWAVPGDPAASFGRFAHHVHDGVMHVPEIDVEAYFEEVERCRSLFPDLRIFSGLEIGEPHWFPDKTAELLASGPFERVLGSLHSLQIGDAPRLLDEWFYTDRVQGADEANAVRAYLAESIVLLESSAAFEVFAHIDYLTRQINRAGRSHDPGQFEEEYRATLRALASSGRVLELNTRLGLDPMIVRWWYEAGGAAVSFGSDAHEGALVGSGFAEAAAMAEAAGFHAQNDPLDFWRRSNH